MAEHVRVLGFVGIARGVLSMGLGAWLVWASFHIHIQDYQMTPATEETVRLDRLAFLLAGGVCLVFGPAAVLQGALALARKPVARRFGLGIALLDMVNLILFPLSTALGLYGFVVYCHPSTAEYLGAERTS